MSYRMPGEDRDHLRTLMSFPNIESIGSKKEDDLRGCRLEVVKIANAISEYEPVWLHARESDADLAKSMVSENVSVKITPVDSLWMRDTGPVFVETPYGGLAGIDFHFNHWGEHVPSESDFDRSLAARILQESATPRVSAPITTEGGALEVDGTGTFMGTESSLINPNRNSDLSRIEIEKALCSTLGISKFIWFKGIEFFQGDVTDCHVDGLARFAPNATVLLARPYRTTPDNDPLYGVYTNARLVLESATNAKGRRLKVIEIQSPPQVYEAPGLTYVNYLLVNGAIIVPTFDHPETDEPAMKTFNSIFPGRHVVPVSLHFLPIEGGGIHCATQQWPLLA